MRYRSDQKQRTRRHIVETASRVLRRDGIAGSSIVPLMTEAGLTQGAFYANFASRDEMVGEALDHALRQTRGFVQAQIAAACEAGDLPIGRIIDWYLSERHLTNQEHSCVVATLGPELCRQSEVIRARIFDACEEMVVEIAGAMPAQTREHAGPLYMMMAGVLSQARLAPTEAQRDAILRKGRAAARMLAGLAD